jgi:hypothetical protein
MKELAVIFFCTWKFAATFPVAIYALNMSPVEILIYTNTGGILGALVFLKLSKQIIGWWNENRPKALFSQKKKRKTFTRSNRRLVRIKINYGLMGIVILSPVLLSIPIGAFLAARYYGTKTRVAAWLIAGQVFWSVIYTIIYTHLRDVAVVIADLLRPLRLLSELCG